MILSRGLRCSESSKWTKHWWAARPRAREWPTRATRLGWLVPSSVAVKIRVERVPNIRRHTLHAFISRTVKDEAEAIYTDELKSYLGIADHDTRHQTVNHSAEQWVVGDVHTNSIDGVWSLFKRSIVGTFHKMSVKHLDRYLEELEWRFNNRGNRNIFRDTIKRIVNTGNLTYKDLVA